MYTLSSEKEESGDMFWTGEQFNPGRRHFESFNCLIRLKEAVDE